MTEVKIGLIGSGEIAQNFHLPILHRLPNVKVVAIHDKNITKAKLIAEKYDIPYVCETLNEILAIDELDAVDICTSTDAHCDIALAAIAAKKNALIEKPIARNYEEAKLIEDALVGSKCKVMIGTNQRFRYDAKMLKNFVQMGEIGEVFYLQGSWLQQKRSSEWRHQIEKSGGGVLVDLGISLIDSLLWITGFPEVEAVNASMFKHKTKTVEDVCIANVRFKNQSIATLEMSWSLFSSRSNFAFNVYGSQGAAKINPLRLFKGNGDIFEPIDNTDTLSNITIHRKSFDSEIKHFINSLLDLGPVISTVSEAVQTMRIIDAMYLSAQTNQEIKLT